MSEKNSHMLECLIVRLLKPLCWPQNAFAKFPCNVHPKGEGFG